MTTSNLHCRYFETDEPDFDRALSCLVSAYRPLALPVRLVFFGAPADNAEYLRQRQTIEQTVRQTFGEQAPVVSYVAQPPLLGRSWLLEVHEETIDSWTHVHYKTQFGIRYILTEDRSGRSLYVGGIQADRLDLPVGEQAEAIFDRIRKILSAEHIPVESIVRQWNYIERITGFDGDRQRYQDFNDSRSLFYRKAGWTNGYPAATGIGTSVGGVMVELQAFVPVGSGQFVFPVDNRLQIAAHNYSQQVLVGTVQDSVCTKTTPKFERAKLVVKNGEGQLFISGTAAIRGELTVESMEVSEQTDVTIDNIEYLISPEALSAAGFPADRNCRLLNFRVYVKHPADARAVRQAVIRRYPALPAVYVEADVCRDDLLVEIEGTAQY